MGVYIFSKVCHSFSLVVNFTFILIGITIDYHLFAFQNLTKPGDLLFDSGNWNSISEPQTTDIVLAACGMK